MKFILTRTSTRGLEDKPHPSAVRGAFIPIDRRTVATPEELACGPETWYLSGCNHRVVDGFIERDCTPQDCWMVDLYTYEGLMAFIKEVGEVVITYSNTVEEYPELEIYDTYRE